MNNIDRQYKELLEHILVFGNNKNDRTGTGTRSIFGWKIVHRMEEGFPLLTTKKMYSKGIITELLWFLRGETNIKYLVDENGNFNVISNNVSIGNNVEIGNNVRIENNVIIGDNVRIFDGVIIGTEPQDIKVFDGVNNGKVIIGSGTTLREYVTVHKNVDKSGFTKIGNDCYLMAYSHVSHDTILGNNVILTNSTQIGGYSYIGDYSNLAGGVMVHQRSKIGPYTMIGMNSVIMKDIPPFALVSGMPAEFSKINLVLLKKLKFTSQQIENISNCYKKLRDHDKTLTQKVNEMLLNVENLESRIILEFISNSKRGIIRI